MRDWSEACDFAHFAAGEELDRTSTDETQSSCSYEATKSGGISAFTYSMVRVVSAEMPFCVRKSSNEVRRNWPLMRNSRGTGWVVSRRRLTRVDNW